MEKNNFLQSEAWERFQKAIGRETTRIDGNLAITYSLPLFGKYLFIPHGPAILNKNSLEKIKDIAKKTGVIFVRVEPDTIDIRSSRIIKTTNIHPDTTLVIDLNKSTEELFDDLKQKTRYNIRLAEKKGVRIETTANPENTKIFFDLVKETSTRDQIRSHPKNHYKKLLETLGPDNKVIMYLARYQNQYIASSIVVYNNDTATYLHGASSNAYRNVMAPYLLQWQAICEAKKNGYKKYDFFGIADTDDENHPWHGITRFKKGFGGSIVSRPGTYDIVVNKLLYFIYSSARKIQRKLRRKTV